MRLLLKPHFYHCHNYKKQKGKVRLDDLPYVINDIVATERFAKHQKVAREVAFSGPRDQLESWQSLPSATHARIGISIIIS